MRGRLTQAEMVDIAAYTEVEVRKLRPTQLTVSMEHVNELRAQIRTAVARHQLGDFLTWRPLRAALGPRGEMFVIDPHAVARALVDEAVERCLVVIEQNLSSVVPDRFWVVMERQGWVLPVDAAGRRRGYSTVPRDFFRLEDDPYRTLALLIRDAGACEEWEGGAAEIAWAAFLRVRIPSQLLSSEREEVMRQAFRHARSESARRLPGWKGK